MAYAHFNVKYYRPIFFIVRFVALVDALDVRDWVLSTRWCPLSIVAIQVYTAFV